MKRDLGELEKKLGYIFNNRGLLQTALIHSSYAHEHSMKCNNERMELLGDAVIHLALTEFLMDTYIDENEGNLSALRSYCESEGFLYERAKSIDLGDFIFFGKGEATNGGQYKESLLANAYEAVVAAVHQDSNYKKAKLIILEHFKEHVIHAYVEKLYMDSKSELQKVTQKYFNSLPEYTVVDEQGEEHNKVFVIRAVVDIYEATGSGKTKKIAEKLAARKLLDLLHEHKSGK